jgi:uncharacterized membrane protein YbaN (DUF454 family)
MLKASGKFKQRFFIIAGTVSIGLGLIGILLPVLPTTPFLLLAAICYMRGSQRLYQALLSNRFLGDYIKNYLEGKGMSLKMKIRTLCLLWILIIGTMHFLTDSWVIKIILGLVLTGVTIHILAIKTMEKKKKCSENPITPDR